MGHDWQVNDVIWWKCTRCECFISRELMTVPNPDIPVSDDIEKKKMTCEEVQVWRIQNQ